MQVFEDDFLKTENLGFYVGLYPSEDNKIYLDMEAADPFRWNLRIGLPPGNHEATRKALFLALVRAESGLQFPIQFDYENLLEFISLEDLKCVEKSMPDISFRVYGAPCKKSRSKWTYYQIRMARQKRENPSAAPS